MTNSNVIYLRTPVANNETIVDSDYFGSEKNPVDLITLLQMLQKNNTPDA